MHYKTSFILAFILLFCTLLSFSQVIKESHDPVYGFDPLLYNGRVYQFYVAPGTGGTQYLFDKFDTLGSLTLRGVTYNNLTLNYDIYNQLIILKYKNTVGSYSLIEISQAWLEKSSMSGCNFENVTNVSSGKSIYQVIGNGADKIMYYRNKELLIDNLGGSMNHYFSDTRKQMFVLTNNQLKPFKKRKDFIKAFSPSRQALIKTYIRKHNINLKTASDFNMTDLINYCNTLP